MKFLLTSLNLQGYDYWDVRFPHILHYLQDTNPEFICFQEVVYLPTISTYNQVAVLNQKLGYPYEYSDVTRLQVGLEHPIYREGLASLSRYQVAKTETIILKQTNGDRHNRIIQLLDVKINNTVMVKIANIHLSVTDMVDFATPQLQEILDLLKARGEKRIIIGDFNINLLEESSTLWKNDYISTCDTDYISYPKTNKRIDYALVPNEYSITSVSVSGDDLSDHRALTVAIEIPDSI